MNSPLEDLSCYLTDDERRRLVTSLHDILTWIGVQPPYEFRIDPELLKKEMEKLDLKESIPPELHLDKGVIDLRNLIWRLVNEKRLTENEEAEIKELINILRIKENQDEETLKEANLTCQQAKQLYGETESIIRSLVDLKEILSQKKSSGYERDEVVKKKVDDIKRWNDYVKNIER
jgi:Family of unknown function (DUF5788)